MELISMADFVLKTVQTPNINEAICWEQTEDRLSKIYHYALFLKQPLKLEMFVQRVGDEDGVLFEGFKYTEGQKYSMVNKIDKSIHDYSDGRFYITIKKLKSWHSYFQIFTIEDLIQCDVKLTQTALKQIGS